MMVLAHATAANLLDRAFDVMLKAMVPEGCFILDTRQSPAWPRF
jgi:3-polyprenyl-4-hydroxybenzoate decarboxylase